MKKYHAKLLDWLGEIVALAACGIGGWVHTEVTKLHTDVALLQFCTKCYLVTATPAARQQPSLFSRGERAQLAEVMAFSSLKPKESHVEKPGQ